MEVPGMDEVKKAENRITSASAFVEGGAQDTCDDACSICLEDFSNTDPSTVTTCKHEFHLQCILQWCRRSSNCPMCWQPIRLKDPASQELLVSVEQERRFRSIPSRNTRIFHHPSLGDFELPRLSVGLNDPEFEERIIQHVAAVAAMRRSKQIATREGSRSRSSAQARPQFVVSAANSNASSSSPVLVSLAPYGAETGSAATSYWGEPSSPNTDGAGPSDFQSTSDIWRSRLSSMSMRYKESISRNVRGWKEKLFSRSSSMADIGSEVRRGINAGIGTVSSMIEHLETEDDNRGSRYETPSNGSNTTNAAH